MPDLEHSGHKTERLRVVDWEQPENNGYLLVRFRFAGVDEQARYAFMKRFDLYMQRGGG